MEFRMSRNNRSLFGIGFTLATALVLGVVAWAGLVYGQSMSANPRQAVLQGSIHIEPEKPLDQEHPPKVQPGTGVKLSVVVDNKGDVASPSGKIYIRYAFAKPLDNEEKSIVFQTEDQELPSIEPGKTVDINFKTPHQWPSLMDYIRNDWLMREYQAIAVINNVEKTIGTLAITFSAYYYPGIKKEFPTPIPGVGAQ
jgi:hypothetical protein